MPTVSGVVTTPGGKPLPGVHVLAWDTDQPRRRVEGHTDRTGTWRLELPAGEWTVRPVGHEPHRVIVGADPVRVDAAEARAVGTALAFSDGPLGRDRPEPTHEPDVPAVQLHFGSRPDGLHSAGGADDGDVPASTLRLDGPAVDERGPVARLSYDTDPGDLVPEPLPEHEPAPDRERRIPRDGGRTGQAPGASRRSAERQAPPAQPVKTRPARTPRDGGRVHDTARTEEN